MYAPEAAQAHEDVQAGDHHQGHHERLVVRLIDAEAVHECPQVEPAGVQDGKGQHAAAERPVEGNVQRHILDQLVDAVLLFGLRRAHAGRMGHVTCNRRGPCLRVV